MDDPVAALTELVRELGAPPDRIEAASREGAPGLLALAVETVVVPGQERLNRLEVAERAGTSVERAQRFWRAMGFADVGDEERVFNEADVEALRSAVGFLESELVTEERALRMTRLVAQSAARMAEAQTEIMRDRVLAAVAAGSPPEAAAVELVASAREFLGELERALVYVWRRHLAAVSERLILQMREGAPEHGEAVVGFADLVGFTAISQELDDEALGAAVARFEAAAADVIGAAEGRVVKMIGDEVMFSGPSPEAAAEIALTLVETFAADEDLPDVRVGLAVGSALPFQGDLFGPPVNLASRLVNLAYPGSVLVSEELAAALEEDARFTLKPVRARRLKGIGRARPFVLRRGDGVTT